jgi:predicted house-cleaning NTP pyrophosphatase (Maf/HAM1 superfamily)
MLFAEDVVVTDGLTGAIIASSREELRPRYVERFATPVHCELLGRLVLGNVVVDREVITGLPDGVVADCLATYVCDVDANEIKRITFVWQARTEEGVVAASDGGGGGAVVEDADADPLTRRGLPSPLLLGSASFTRKLILSEMNVPYAKLVRPIDERGIGNRDGDPMELVTMLAHAKMTHLVGEILGGNELPSSSAYDGGGRRGWVILTADQVVTHGGRVLEKPGSVEEAREFVEGYADGGPVSTHGACVLAHLPSGLRTSGVDTASVYFGGTVPPGGARLAHNPKRQYRVPQRCAPLLDGELYDDAQRRVLFIEQPPIATATIAILHNINSSGAMAVHLFFVLVELEFLRLFLPRFSMYSITLVIL